MHYIGHTVIVVVSVPGGIVYINEPTGNGDDYFFRVVLYLNSIQSTKAEMALRYSKSYRPAYAAIFIVVRIL